MSTTSYTRSATETVAVTHVRLNAVLLQVRVDFINAVAAGLATHERVTSWRDDLEYMLFNNALEHFELRVERGATRWNTWRYVVSNDGTLQETSRGGGIDFWQAPPGYEASLVIRRRADLDANVSAEIDRRGWIRKVDSVTGAAERERAYSKDAWGTIRFRIEG